MQILIPNPFMFLEWWRQPEPPEPPKPAAPEFYGWEHVNRYMDLVQVPAALLDLNERLSKLEGKE